MKSRIVYGVFTLLFSFITFAQEGHPLEGKWNLTITEDGKEVPSWLEVRHSGNNTMVGKFCYKFGSARPIAEVVMTDSLFSFSIPNQWEPAGIDMQIIGKQKGEKLTGTLIYTDGKSYSFTGKPSPDLPYNENPKWGKSKKLFNGKNLDG